MSQPLLLTKCHRPRPRATTLRRERLFRRLDPATTVPVSLISAPAGFGKSTLVSSWLDDRGLAAAWFSCDAGDTDPHRLLRYLVHAIRTVAADVLADVADRCADTVPPPVDHLITQIANDLAIHGKDILLVIDDAHLLSDDLITTVIMPLMEQVGEHLRQVLLCRSDPPIPLARERTRGRLIEVRAADLRVQQDEVGELFATSLAVRLTDSQAAMLLEKTEGWVAGLKLAALSLQNRTDTDTDAFLQAFAGTDAFVLDYLLEEVLNSLDARLRGAILRLSVLEQFNAEAAEHVTGLDGEDLITELDRRNLFLIPLDSQRIWYRFHHLFADLLQRRTRHEMAEADTLFSLAAEWFIQHRLPAIGLRTLRNVEDAQLRAGVMRRGWTHFMAENVMDAVLRELAGLPRTMVENDPRLLTAECNALMNHYHFAQVTDIFDMWQAALDMEKDPVAHKFIEARLTFVKGVLRVIRHDYSQDEGYLERSATLLRSMSRADAAEAGMMPEAVDIALHETEVLLSRSFIALGRIDEALDLLHRMKDRHRLHADHAEEVQAIEDIVRVHVLIGDVRAARRIMVEHDELAERYGIRYDPANETEVITLRARLALERCDFDEAVSWCNKAYDVQKRERYLRIVQAFNCYQTEQRIACMRGDYGRAHEILDVLRTASYPGLQDYFTEALLLMETWMAFMNGEDETVDHWLVRCERDYLPEWNKPKHQIFGRIGTIGLYLNVHARRSGRERISGLLAEALDFTKTHQMPRQHAEFLLVRMMIAVHEQRMDEAVDACMDALAICARYDMTSPFFNVFDRKDTVTDLINAGLNRRTPSGDLVAAAERILGTWPEGSGRANDTAARPSLNIQLRLNPDTQRLDLTPREIETLALLVQGNTNQRIADKLYVSLATVKTHLYNLYQKLGVGNRAEAIVRARGLGISDR